MPKKKLETAAAVTARSRRFRARKKKLKEVLMPKFIVETEYVRECRRLEEMK